MTYGIYNLTKLWSTKVRENLSIYFKNQKLLTLLDELDHKITNFESKIENKENEKKEKKKKIKESLSKYQVTNSLIKSMKLPKYNFRQSRNNENANNNTNPGYKVYTKQRPVKNKLELKETTLSKNERNMMDKKVSKYDSKNDLSLFRSLGIKTMIARKIFRLDEKDKDKGKDKENKVDNSINLSKINNLENNIFNYSQEKLNKNIFETKKKNQKIISFIDIDLFLQKIAEEKDIYENLDDNKTLMDGFCIQHPIFIQTNTLVSKIISCFNYFYSRYLNQDNEDEDENEDNISKYSLRNKYKKPKIKNEVFDSNIFVQNLKKIPYRLIDLVILFVDLHDKYDPAPLTNEVIDKIEGFYNNLSYIYDIKNKYSKDIENSKKKVRVIKNIGLLKRTKTPWKKVPFQTLFPKKRLLSDKIRDPENPLSFFDIFCYKSVDIAKELTRISYHQLLKIKPKEFFKGVFTKKNKDKTSPNITHMTECFNKLSYWATEEILSFDYPEDRALVIEKLIDISNELINLNNFNDSMSIASGLGLFFVNKNYLSKTWKHVSKKSMKIFENIKNILNFQDNYKNLREKIEECQEKNIPYIPYLGIYNKRICFLEEYGPYVKDKSLVNVDKIVLVQQILDQIFQFRAYNYDIFGSRKNELIFFQCLDPSEENKLEKLASALEPNFTLNNKKNHEKRITNSELNFKQNYEQNEEFI